jgi:hypothetical protein
VEIETKQANFKKTMTALQLQESISPINESNVCNERTCHLSRGHISDGFHQQVIKGEKKNFSLR